MVQMILVSCRRLHTVRQIDCKILCKDFANEPNESVLSNCRVQLNLMQSYDRLPLATTPYVYLTSEKADFACFTRLFAVFSKQSDSDLANSNAPLLWFMTRPCASLWLTRSCPQPFCAPPPSPPSSNRAGCRWPSSSERCGCWRTA